MLKSDIQDIVSGFLRLRKLCVEGNKDICDKVNYRAKIFENIISVDEVDGVDRDG